MASERRPLTCTHCGGAIVEVYHQDVVRLSEASVVGGPRHIVEIEYELTHCAECHERLGGFVPLARDDDLARDDLAPDDGGGT